MLLALLLEVAPNQTVHLPGLSKYPLPHLCLTRRWLHVDCPGCGLTRSFIHLAHGRWRESLTAHPVGWLAALAVLFQIPYRLYALCTPDAVLLSRVIVRAFAAGLAVLLFGCWLWRLVL